MHEPNLQRSPILWTIFFNVNGPVPRRGLLIYRLHAIWHCACLDVKRIVGVYRIARCVRLPSS